MNHRETITFEVNKELILKKLQSKRKAKSINDYINQLIMKDLDNLFIKFLNTIALIWWVAPLL